MLLPLPRAEISLSYVSSTVVFRRTKISYSISRPTEGIRFAQKDLGALRFLDDWSQPKGIKCSAVSTKSAAKDMHETTHVRQVHPIPVNLFVMCVEGINDEISRKLHHTEGLLVQNETAVGALGCEIMLKISCAVLGNVCYITSHDSEPSDGHEVGKELTCIDACTALRTFEPIVLEARHSV